MKIKKISLTSCQPFKFLPVLRELFGVMELFCILVTQMYSFVKTHQTVYFKRVNFTVYKVYLNKPDQKQNQNQNCLSLPSLTDLILWCYNDNVCILFLVLTPMQLFKVPFHVTTLS